MVAKKKKTTKKKPTAYQKAKASYDRANKALKSAKKAYYHANRMYGQYYNDAKYSGDPKYRKKYATLRDKWAKTRKSAKSRRDRAKKVYDKANSRLKALNKKRDNLNAISESIQQQRTKWNEGHAAIYPTDGKSSKVIFISPSDTESEETQTNVSSYPVDKGSPRSNYARTSGKTAQISGLVTGNTRAEAMAKWEQIRSWNSRHRELTYKGSFTYHHLIINNISQNFTNLRDNLQVTIGFTFVYAAVITSSTGKTANAKKAKSSKTTQGSRNKKYTCITIKYGDTLLGLSRKYGRSVAWLQKVNHIKNPNKIYAGRNLYVSPRKQKLAKKVRVK